jgi:phosphatidylglycerol---prolipoprotein diacylglyceryl transferase
MRKVLLRFIFSDYWAWQSAGNEFLIGVGWLLIGWCLVAIAAAWVTWKLTKDLSQIRSSALIWCAVPAFLLAVPLLRFPFVNSGIPVFGYGFMMFIGFTSATVLAARRIKNVGLSSDVIWDLMMWILVPGLIGARVNYLAQNWQNVMGDKQGAQKLLALVSLWDGGIVFYGCVIGGVIGLLAFCHRRKIDPIIVCDVIVPSLFVGVGFGRIGCFLYGCCYGHACSLPWAVRFPSDSLTFERLVERGTVAADASHTIPLHPTQLYSSAAAFLLAALLAWLFRRRTFDGLVLSIAWILYPINRYILEIFRNDEPPRLGTDQSYSQLFSMGLIVTGVIALVWFSKRNKLTRATPEQMAGSNRTLQPSDA